MHPLFSARCLQPVGRKVDNARCMQPSYRKVDLVPFNGPSSCWAQYVSCVKSVGGQMMDLEASGKGLAPEVVDRVLRLQPAGAAADGAGAEGRTTASERIYTWIVSAAQGCAGDGGDYMTDHLGAFLKITVLHLVRSYPRSSAKVAALLYGPGAPAAAVRRIQARPDGLAAILQALAASANDSTDSARSARLRQVARQTREREKGPFQPWLSTDQGEREGSLPAGEREGPLLALVLYTLGYPHSASGDSDSGRTAPCVRCGPQVGLMCQVQRKWD